MMVDLLLFSVENNVFPSSHDDKAVSDDHVTTTRRADILRCAELPAASQKSDQIPIDWREQLMRGPGEK